MRYVVLSFLVGVAGVGYLQSMDEFDLASLSETQPFNGSQYSAQATMSAPVPTSAQALGMPGPVQGPGSMPSGTAPLSWQDRPGDAEESGVTTINETRGNWFFKAKILKDARKLYDKISKKIAAIQPLQEKFLDERAKIDIVLAEFYREYGFKAGEIDERLDMFNEQLKKLDETTSPLDDQEKVLQEETRKRKDEVESLKREFEFLQKLEEALSKGLVTMSAQITKANGYGDQAWDSYERIEDTLSDEAAEDLLNKIQTIFENVAAIENYLTGDFRVFFATTAQKISQQIEIVRQRVLVLKEHGVALGKKMQELQQKEDELRLQEEEALRIKKSKEKVQAQRTWLSPVFDVISWVWTTIRDIFVLGYETVTGWFTSKPVKKRPAPVIDVPQEQPIELPAQIEEPRPALSQPVSVSAPMPAPTFVAIAPQPQVSAPTPQPVSASTPSQSQINGITPAPMPMQGPSQEQAPIMAPVGQQAPSQGPANIAPAPLQQPLPSQIPTGGPQVQQPAVNQMPAGAPQGQQMLPVSPAMPQNDLDVTGLTF